MMDLVWLVEGVCVTIGGRLSASTDGSQVTVILRAVAEMAQVELSI